MTQQVIRKKSSRASIAVALLAGLLVNDVPLPDGFDFASYRLRIDPPQLGPDDFLNVYLVVVSGMSGHLVQIGVVVPMPSPPEKPLLVDQVLPRVEITAAGIVAIVSDATVTLYAPVHLMMHERPQMLVPVSALAKPVAAVVMA